MFRLILEHPVAFLIVCIGLLILGRESLRLLKSLMSWFPRIVIQLWNEIVRGDSGLAERLDLFLIVASLAAFVLSFLCEKVPAAVRQALGHVLGDGEPAYLTWATLFSFLFFGIASPVFLLIQNAERQVWNAGRAPEAGPGGSDASEERKVSDE